ncbi:hypothetical protein [Streptomyces sp. NPDC093060]|uniref:hypothetical protein n=1 Tax=Streptomyces sp. NPDC093060 TaxID=3366019 RepID=UPI0038156E2C
MINRRTAAGAALLAACLFATACTGEPATKDSATKESAIPEKFPATGDRAEMKANAKALRDYGKTHSLSKVTGDVERIQDGAAGGGHALISTNIGAEDEAMARAQQVADAYRDYAGGAGKPAKASTVTVYNVFGDPLVTQRLGKK